MSDFERGLVGGSRLGWRELTKTLAAARRVAAIGLTADAAPVISLLVRAWPRIVL